MSETKSSTDEKGISNPSGQENDHDDDAPSASVDSISQITSIDSSAADTQSSLEVKAFVPNPETSSATRRKSSWFGRLSTRTDSFFTTHEEIPPSIALNLIDEDIARDHGDWFGGTGFQRCLTRDKTDVESTLGPLDLPPGELKPDLLNEQPSSLLPPPVRRKSTIATMTQETARKLGFWDEEFQKWRMVMVFSFLKNYVIIILGFTIALSIYWGSFYNRSNYYHRLKFAVILGEDNSSNIPPVLSSTVEALINNVPQLHQYGTFSIVNYTTINAKAAQHNRNITEQVVWEMQHHKYWAIFYIKPNATLNWYTALASATPMDISTSLMSLYISTGNDYNAYNNVVRSIIMAFFSIWYSFVSKSNLTFNMASMLNSTQTETVIENAPGLLTTVPSFELIDLHPVIKQVYQGPLQLGLIYLVTFTFFQYLFSKEIQAFTAQRLKGVQYMIARVAISQAAYVVIGLSYTLLNRAFGINYNHAFGRAGFLVVWGLASLTCSAVGSVVELFGVIAVTFNPAFVGFVLLGNVVVNLTPVVSPPIICNAFYRYGYAMPIYASYKLMLMVYFNTNRSDMGLYIGILCAWVAVTNSLAPFILRYVSKVASRKQAEANKT
ncbi:uncharacterized protein KQ657_004064 [Scheffersomyces spartinae]|uniref:DUF3533 domain-containing protein n=1 Tax=Scheffersomyces spartinae TaxID=45513 RepID=A0A9P8AJJ8_9ASCO|nr:uncharacterized protein KQ657_004064 [Scheffersomyces spartinae]KAG7194954.1 hypothetical protein KQ657_004064 [Scheffersomyces spartinae]